MKNDAIEPYANKAMESVMQQTNRKELGRPYTRLVLSGGLDSTLKRSDVLSVDEYRIDNDSEHMTAERAQ